MLIKMERGLSAPIQRGATTMDDLLCGWAFEQAEMLDRWKQLVRAAIRAEIEKGREVNSITRDT
jgi:hypothetical protein